MEPSDFGVMFNIWIIFSPTTVYKLFHFCLPSPPNPYLRCHAYQRLNSMHKWTNSLFSSLFLCSFWPFLRWDRSFRWLLKEPLGSPRLVFHNAYFLDAVFLGFVLCCLNLGLPAFGFPVLPFPGLFSCCLPLAPLDFLPPLADG